RRNAFHMMRRADPVPASSFTSSTTRCITSLRTNGLAMSTMPASVGNATAIEPPRKSVPTIVKRPRKRHAASGITITTARIKARAVISSYGVVRADDSEAGDVQREEADIRHATKFVFGRSREDRAEQDEPEHPSKSEHRSINCERQLVAIQRDQY